LPSLRSLVKTSDDHSNVAHLSTFYKVSWIWRCLELLFCRSWSFDYESVEQTSKDKNSIRFLLLILWLKGVTITKKITCLSRLMNEFRKLICRLKFRYYNVLSYFVIIKYQYMHFHRYKKVNDCKRRRLWCVVSLLRTMKVSRLILYNDNIQLSRGISSSKTITVYIWYY